MTDKIFGVVLLLMAVWLIAIYMDNSKPEPRYIGDPKKIEQLEKRIEVLEKQAGIVIVEKPGRKK